MENCVNKNSPEFKNLLEQTQVNEIILAAKISIWQDKNGLNNFPNIKDLYLDNAINYSLNAVKILLSDKAKQSVSELFESNPKLADEVYEVLGITQKNNISEKNIFTVEPIQSVDKKAKSKAKIATQYIGFAEGIEGSSTALYAKQAGQYANTGNYSADDVIFVSVAGRRGNEAIRKEQQDKTIREAIKAIEAGSTLITDNKSYVESSSYNEGEKRLAVNLQAKGYNYYEITIDGNLLGVWNNIKTQITTQQKQQAQQLYSQYLDTIFPDSKVKDIVYHGSNIKFEEFLEDNLNYFGTKEIAKGYGKNLYSALIEINKPYYEDGGNLSNQSYEDLYDKLDDADSDGFINNNKNLFVPKSETQIHLLGSKQDIEGFKEFVNNKANQNNDIKYNEKGEFSKENDNIYKQEQVTQPEIDSVLQEFANDLSNRFNIPFELINEREAKKDNPNYNGETAFFNPKTNKAYLVKGKANKTSAIHEIFTHPFLLQIEKTNPKLYNNLLKEAKSNKNIVDYVNRVYGNKSNIYIDTKGIQIGKPSINNDQYESDIYIININGEYAGNFSITKRHGYDKLPIEKVGYLSGSMATSGIELEHKFRGKGFGTKVYLAIAKSLSKEGITLKSEFFGKTEISKKANNVWQSLFKKGYAVDKGNYFEIKLKNNQETQNTKEKASQHTLDHEYIARAVDLFAQDELDQQKYKGLIARIKELFAELSDYLKKLFNISEVFSNSISPNITLRQLTQFAMYGKGKMNLNVSHFENLKNIINQSTENLTNKLEQFKKENDPYDPFTCIFI